MLNWTRALGLAAISGSVSMSASAQSADSPLFAFFKTFCADTRGSEAAVKSAVEAAGGEVTILPDTETSPLKMRWEKITGGRKIRLAVGGWRQPPRVNLNEPYITECYVWDDSHDIAGAEAIRNWVGVPPSDTHPSGDPRGITYTYKDVAGVRSAISAYRYNDTDDVWRLVVIDDAGAIYVHMYHSTMARRVP